MLRDVVMRHTCSLRWGLQYCTNTNDLVDLQQATERRRQVVVGTGAWLNARPPCVPMP